MKKNWTLIPAAFGIMLLILDAKNAAASAAEAVKVCIHTVIPGLFPFFLLSGYLTRGMQGGKWVAKVFCSDPNCGGVILSGLLGGYPVGAKVASEGFQDGSLTWQQANRLLSFCSQAGPSFLFGMVAGQFDEIRYAWALWGIQILSSLTVAQLIPGKDTFTTTEKPKANAADPMHSALRAMGSVCGWVIMFAIVIGFLKRWVLWLLPENTQILLCGLLELTNGCLMLLNIQDISLRFLLAAVMLNFGGICVLLQTVSVNQGLEIRNYILGKFLQTAIAILYALMFLGIWSAAIPLLAVFFAKCKWNPGKRYSNPARNSV